MWPCVSTRRPENGTNSTTTSECEILEMRRMVLMVPSVLIFSVSDSSESSLISSSAYLLFYERA